MKMNALDGGPNQQMQNFDNFEQIPRPMQGQIPMGQMQDGMQQQMAMMQQQQQQQVAAQQQQQQLRIPPNMNPGINPQAASQVRLS